MKNEIQTTDYYFHNFFIFIRNGKRNTYFVFHFHEGIDYQSNIKINFMIILTTMDYTLFVFHEQVRFKSTKIYPVQW